MKVYILFRNYDYEGGAILKVYADKTEADADLKWVNENQSDIRCYEQSNPVCVEYERRFGTRYAGDSWHLETHTVWGKP